MKKIVFFLSCILIIRLLSGCTSGPESREYKDLAGNFLNPPEDARIWVYWFWLNSNITKEGITADLEAMKRAGVGGVLIMEVDQGAPVGPVDFMGTQWQELFRFMLSESNRLGIKVNMNDDAGWNGSGGPWVPVDKSMQTVVFTELMVPAGSPFKGLLERPKTNGGYYRDIAVVAFPTPSDPDNPQNRISDLASKSMAWGGMFGGSLNAATGDSLAPEKLIGPDQVTDISANMDTSGILTWNPPVQATPQGTWTVIRFGHTFTGAVNGPAPKSGTGPECDKLSKDGITANYNGMIGKLVQNNRDFVGKSFVATHVDSWEVGSQNWTREMREEFRRLRGYDMTPFLPVMTGRIVGSPEISGRFLRDVRQTISDLLSVNYIGYLRELANKDGIKLSMEAYSTPANDLDVGNYIDEPISEFWWPGGGGFWWTQKAMSSLSHVNGLPVTGAESFTSDAGERWLAHPAIIKSLGDKAFCDGVNRFIVHRYAMQPWTDDRNPGMTMGPWGLHYERTNTWWEDSKGWHEYVARCQYLLRQGKFVADVLSLQSEEPMKRFKPLKITGYDYDGISPQAFLKLAFVKDGLIMLPSGMQYRMLVLPDDPDMSVEMLEKIRELVDQGAVICGNPPERSAGLKGFPDSDSKIAGLASEIWGEGTGNDHSFGKGRVIRGETPAEALEILEIEPDFKSDGGLNFIHRRIGENELYFIASPETREVDVVCSFRVQGMIPEAWDPKSGKISQISVFSEQKGRITIPLHLEPSGSLFILFREGKLRETDRTVSVKFEGMEQASTEFRKEAEKTESSGAEAITNFTIAGWVYPEMEIALAEESNTGTGGLGGERNDVVYAAPGHEVWTEKDAGAGFGVGNNGISVYEHTANYFPAPLMYPAEINGWTHVAVVYKNNRPSLFINGKWVKDGLQSQFRVHGGLGVKHTRTVKPFAGQVTGLFQTAQAMTPDEILKLYRIQPDTAGKKHQERIIDLLDREIYVNGNFELTNGSGHSDKISVDGIPEKQLIGGPWEVSFDEKWGGPATITLDNLISWHRHEDPRVRYYSGSAVYKNSFSFKKPEHHPGLDPKVYLDLGKVAIMAEVKVNGQSTSILWKPPYRADITDLLKQGVNNLEIRVVNLWINRMIGDEFLPEDSDRNQNGTLKNWPDWLNERKPSPAGRYTFTSWRLWKKDSQLQPSGLLGPVSIQTVMKF